MKDPGSIKDARSDGATKLKADVCIVGSGAGGAVMAAQLQEAGFEVLVLEEGGHYTKADFKMREDLAYPQLYQEGGTRATKDVGIAVLQGRAVGGTTVVNWTTCFRTPEYVLDRWRTAHAVNGFAKKDLDPHWDAVEERLNIREIPIEESNRNNKLFYDGCKTLGLEAAPTRRNVKQCMKSGYCSMGCPIDAKQSMLVSYLPDAVSKGTTVMSRCRVDKLVVEAGRVVRAECSVIDGYKPTGKTLTVEAKWFVLAAGAIGTPSILIRSGLGGGVVGKRTFLHPVAGTAALWKDPIEPFYGAPQSVASHALAHRGDKMGLFMEAAPLHPMIAALATPRFGADLHKAAKELPRLSAHIALAIDGHHPDEPGGTVEVRPSGHPVLDYPIHPRVWEALREGVKTLIRIDLAAGAEEVFTSHEPPISFKSEKDLGKLDSAMFDTHRLAVFSAHVMGGCSMGDDANSSVVRSSDLRHHTLANLHVVDGSVFPTATGVNPSESIYGIAHLMAERLAKSWR